MMTSIEKIDALVAGVTRTDIAKMPPAHRQRLAQVLRYIADLADPPIVRQRLGPAGVDDEARRCARLSSRRPASVAEPRDRPRVTERGRRAGLRGRRRVLRRTAAARGHEGDEHRGYSGEASC